MNYLLESAFAITANAATLYIIYILALAAGESLRLVRHSKLLDGVVFSMLMLLASFQGVELSENVRIDLHGALIAIAVLLIGWKRALLPLVAGIAGELVFTRGGELPSIAGAVLGYLTVTAIVAVSLRSNANPPSTLRLFLISAVAASLANALPMLVRTGADFSDVAASFLFELLGALMIGGLAWFTRSRNAALVKSEHLVGQMKQAIMDAAVALGSAMMHRDPVTAHHQERVADLATAIGWKMGIEAHQLEGLTLAGLLHDIGQIEVPSEILSRPGKISFNEIALIRLHPEIGAKILEKIRFQTSVADVVRQHHENYDGTGYPAGLRGEEILISARIMRVADVVDAMSSARPFRPAFRIEEALAEIEHMRGKQFDPVVVDACLSLFREDGYALPKERYREAKRPPVAVAA